MVAEDNQSGSMPLAPKSAPISGENAASRVDSSGSSLSEFDVQLLRSIEIVKDDAAKAAAKRFQPADPKVWAVLTAITNKARKRKKCLNMVLNANVHFIGRLVEEYQFRIDSKLVSGEHCKIYRQIFASGDDALKSQPVVFLKDTSSNGTYVNWKKVTKKNDAVIIHHGDIISFGVFPHADCAFAFVYREVGKSAASSNGIVTKRKAEELVFENKRVKGIGLGAPEGPISLDDFRSLQHLNKELQKQSEDHVVTFDKLQNEYLASVEHNQTLGSALKSIKQEIKNKIGSALKSIKQEIKNKKESIRNSYLNQQSRELQDMLDSNYKEDRNGRLANEIMSRIGIRIIGSTDPKVNVKPFLQPCSSKEVGGVSSKFQRLTITNQGSQEGVDDVNLAVKKMVGI